MQYRASGGKKSGKIDGDEVKLLRQSPKGWAGNSVAWVAGPLPVFDANFRMCSGAPGLSRFGTEVEADQALDVAVICASTRLVIAVSRPCARQHLSVAPCF